MSATVRSLAIAFEAAAMITINMVEQNKQIATAMRDGIDANYYSPIGF